MGFEKLIDSSFPFPEYRTGQRENIEAICDSFFNKNVPVYVLEASTGSGKSVIAYTVGQVANEMFFANSRTKPSVGPMTTICTKTRSLQNQYASTFESAACIWSATHYGCPMYPDDSDVYYGGVLCLKKQCKKFAECQYKKASEHYMLSATGITNYQYYMYAGHLRTHLLVLDEAHNVESVLCDNATLLISSKTMKMITQVLNKNSVFYNGEIQQIAEEAIRCRDCNSDGLIDVMQDLGNELGVIVKRLDALDLPTKFSDWSLPIDELVRFKRLSKIQKMTENLVERVNGFIRFRGEWVISTRDSTKVEYKPLEIQDAFMRTLFSRCSRMLLMSSTICGVEHYCNELGLKPEQYAFKSVPSLFPVENRRVYYSNVATMNVRNKETTFPQIIDAMDNFIDAIEEKGKTRGIIHSVSYDNANTIAKRSRHRHRMRIPDVDEVMNIEKILGESPDTIVVSPSVLEGIDLTDNLSRFQIFPKVPYGFLGDVWVRTKMEMSSEWYSREAIIKIVQGSGRSVRSGDDWAVTLILDGNFSRLLRMRNLFPKWYLDAVEQI